MKVKELLQTLKALTENCSEAEEWEIIMSKDAEGNRFSPLEETSIHEYEPYNTWSGEITNPENSEYNAVCLWPIN